MVMVFTTPTKLRQQILGNLSVFFTRCYFYPVIINANDSKTKKHTPLDPYKENDLLENYKKRGKITRKSQHTHTHTRRHMHIYSHLSEIHFSAFLWMLSRASPPCVFYTVTLWSFISLKDGEEEAGEKEDGKRKGEGEKQERSGGEERKGKRRRGTGRSTIVSGRFRAFWFPIHKPYTSYPGL